MKPRALFRRSSLALSLLAPLWASNARADDVATIKKRAFEFVSMSGASVDYGDPNVKAVADAIVSEATKQAAAMSPKSQTCADGSVRKGSWSDIDYCDIGVGANWQPSNYFSRMLVMAQAYRLPLPGSSLFGSAMLAKQIESALSVVSTFYTPAICHAQVYPGGGRPAMNWWHCEIGTLNNLAPTLLLMEGAVDATVFADVRTQVAGNDCPDMNWSTAPFKCNNEISLTGANLIDVATSRFYYALYPPAGSDSASLLSKVAASVSYAVKRDPTSGEGIQDDFSFLQHGPQVQTGSYGDVFAADVARYMYFTGGTTYALDASSLARALSFVADGVMWSVIGKYYDPSVIDRAVTRPGSGIGGAAMAAMLLALTPSARQSEIAADAKAILTALGGESGPLAPFASPVRARPEAAAMPSGHRHQPAADYTVHRRAGFFGSIKMLSRRTRSGELINQEGKLGSRQSDGRFHLTLSGREWAGVWPALDWSRLPGITVEHKPKDTADATYDLGFRDFVGGVTDGQDGVSALDFEAIDPASAPTAPHLTAKKSWFFFDDSIVFLGADIACPSSNPVETIVEQWPLSAATAALTTNDGSSHVQPFSQTFSSMSWAAADGVGYYFPGGADVTAGAAVQSGDWSSLGVSSGAVTKPFLTLSIAHGTTPTHASYAYVIVPGADAARMAGYAKASPITIAANDNQRGVVHYQGAAFDALGAVLWVAGTASAGGLSVTSDQPAVAYVRRQSDGLVVVGADPAQAGGDLTLTFPNSLAVSSVDPGVSVHVSGTSTSMTFPRDGASHRASFGAIGSGDAGATDASTGGDGGDAGIGDDAGSSANAGHGGCGCEVIGSRSSRTRPLVWAALVVSALARARRRRIT